VSCRTVLLLHSSAGAYGADRQLALIARGLDPDRYRPVVVLAQDGPLAVELRAAGIATDVLDLAVLRRAELNPIGLGRLAARLMRSGRTVAGLAARHDARLIHSNTSVTLSGAAGARQAGVPHIWHVREIYSDFARVWPVYRRLLLGADALACVSAAARAQFGRDAPARVLHDGIAVSDRTVEAIDLDVPDGILVCALLGRISSWKGQDVLIRAIARVEGAVAVIAGDAWPGQESRERGLRDLAAQLGVADRVRFIGFAANPAAVYARADVVVVPSTQPDPLPNAALEGAAAGCCVIASAHGGLPEIVRDGETGLLVPPGDSGALAEAIGRLVDDRGLAGRLGAAARVDVRVRFAPDALLGALQALYDEL
jgi:glycosyltransferase involved in cell wall biosynthesis